MSRADLLTPAGALVAIAVAAAVVPEYWLFLSTSALVSAIALTGLGVVGGRAGMNSLCQLSFAAVGAWTVAKLNVIEAPGTLILWVLAGGVAALPFGVLIGLPALRLRGVHLAVVTLGFAAAADVVISAVRFPGAATFQQVLRPEMLISDRQYFVFAALIFVAVSCVVALLGRTRMGASWRAMRFSERATAAAGTSVARTKLTAFALSAFIAGLAGGVLAGQIGTVTDQNFLAVNSLALFVVAVMAGSEYAGGALFGGILMTFVPEIFRRLNVSQDWSMVLFAAGAVHGLSQGTSMSEGIARKLRSRRTTLITKPPTAPEKAVTPPLGEKPLLVVEGLSVKYGQVTALNEVAITVPEATVMGLIGPNGAGKSTLTDALTGFIPSATGTVTLDGNSLDDLPVHRRAASGLRRTFQQDRVPTGLTVAAYLRFAARRRVARSELTEICEFLGCPPPTAHVSELDVGSRRLLEVAAALLARPKVLILDEPAAGLAHAESMALAARLTEVPARYGTSVLLIEHDLDMVRRACATVVVLNFGEVIAAGPPAETLASPEVARAYLGEVALA